LRLTTRRTLLTGVDVLRRRVVVVLLRGAVVFLRIAIFYII
jgi:hypothetical protein